MDVVNPTFYASHEFHWHSDRKRWSCSCGVVPRPPMTYASEEVARGSWERCHMMDVPHPHEFLGPTVVESAWDPARRWIIVAFFAFIIAVLVVLTLTI